MENWVLPDPATGWTEETEMVPAGPARRMSSRVKLAGSIASEKVSAAPVARLLVRVNLPAVTLAPVLSAGGGLITQSADQVSEASPLTPLLFWSIGLPARSLTCGPTFRV